MSQSVKWGLDIYWKFTGGHNMIELLKAFIAGLILSGLAIWLMWLTGQF